MILTVVTAEDPILREKATNVIDVDLLPANLINDLYETLYYHNQTGLSAPQIGYSLSIIVIDVEIHPGEYFKKVLINPIILDYFGRTHTTEETCLNLPGITKKVSRFDGILVKYYDHHWILKSSFFHGESARIIQHQYDHLKGVLITDY